MPRNLKPETKQLLSNEDWLREQHVTNLFGINELARKLDVTPAVVRKAIRSFNITSPPQQQLREASNTRKYGVPNPGMVQEFRDKALNTMTEKFGGHNWSNEGNRETRDKTCLERYGNANVGKTEHSKQKAKQTNNERYGREHVNQSHISDNDYSKINSIEWVWDQHNNKKRSLSDIANECGVDMSILMNRLRQHNLNTQHFFQSTGEKEILQFIKDILPNTEIQSNVRNIISPHELDIYIPEHNLAIEYCGLYWHSDKFKENYYHRNKLYACQEQNIRLLTIFEDEWRNREDIIKAKIKNVLNVDNRPKVFARKTIITEVDTKTKNQFLDQHHIQGTGPGSITYGLVYETALVAVMTFIRRSPTTYELNRYATSCNVPGGFSKLLKHFCSNNEWKEIISFADLRWSEGKVYEKTGWSLNKILPPDYYWCKNGKRYHKFGFRHKHLPKKLVNYDPNLSENENCKNNRYTKIYNCGLMRFSISHDDHKIT